MHVLQIVWKKHSDNLPLSKKKVGIAGAHAWASRELNGFSFNVCLGVSVYIDTLVLSNAMPGAWSTRHYHGRGASVAKQLGGFLVGGFPEVWHSYSEDDGLAAREAFPEIHSFQILWEKIKNRSLIQIAC